MPHQQLYKSHQSLLSIKSIRFSEDLSGGKVGLIKSDGFQQPYSHKHDNLLECVFTNDHVVSEELISIEIAL